MTSLDDYLTAWGATLTGAPLTTTDDPITTARRAQRVDSIVDRMAHAGRWKEARCLQIECRYPNSPEADRLRELQRHGLAISRSSYYAYLTSARAYLEGALSEDTSEKGAGESAAA